MQDFFMDVNTQQATLYDKYKIHENMKKMLGIA